MRQIGIAIPAYRSATRLRRCLTSIQQIDDQWLKHVSVVDDSGNGEVAAALNSEFSMVKWTIHAQNEGFARAANAAVISSTSEIVLLLNDDSELVNDPRELISTLFHDPELFAVSLRSVDEEGLTREGGKRIVWRMGIARVLHNERDQLQGDGDISPTSYAVGGHAAYRSEIFRDLNGFDPIFNPFYWEDADLCERARKRGFKVFYAKNTAVLHRSDGAIKSHNDMSTVKVATFKNRLLFSHRHSSGLQRILNPLSLLWLRLSARLTRNKVKSKAIDEYLAIRHRT